MLQLCDDERWDIPQLRELLLELCNGDVARHEASQQLDTKMSSTFITSCQIQMANGSIFVRILC